MGATRAELIARARKAADMVNSPFIDADEEGEAIQSAWASLYQLLVRTYEDFFVEEHDLAAVAGTGEYSLEGLEPKLWKLNGIDEVISEEEKVPLKPFSWAERGRITGSGIWTANSRAGFARPKYHLRKKELMLRPIPDAAADLRVYYVPQCPALVEPPDDPEDLTADQITELPEQVEPGWERYIVLLAAIQFLSKENSPTQDLKEQLAMVRSDITGDAPNRDAEEPERMVRRAVYDEDGY